MEYKLYVLLTLHFFPCYMLYSASTSRLTTMRKSATYLLSSSILMSLRKVLKTFKTVYNTQEIVYD